MPPKYPQIVSLLPLFVAIGTALAAPAHARPDAPQVSGWARATVAGQQMAAAYLTIRYAGPGSERLLEVTSTAAKRVSLHETRSSGGVVRMRSAGPPQIRAGEPLVMRSGGLHLMIEGVKAPLRTGTRLPLTLRFARAGTVRVSVPIQMSAPDDRHAH